MILSEALKIIQVLIKVYSCSLQDFIILKPYKLAYTSLILMETLKSFI